MRTTRKTSPQNNRNNPRLKRKMDTTTNNNLNNNNSSSSSSSSSSSNEKEEEKDSRALSEVVLDCGRRWFQETLNEAKSGDVSMQVLLSQMYYHGYGASKDLRKANYWMTKASRARSSVWKVSNKRPGYHASDSDSESEENP